jgi:5'(3')-deoxyribonucleotidase
MRKEIMNRYKVAVLVEYHVSADSVDDAWEKIEQGAEFPVVPYDDETYCDKIQIVSVIDLAQLEEEQSE